MSEQQERVLDVFGLYLGEALVATCRARTVDGAIAAFKSLPSWARRGVRPTRWNVQRRLG